MVLVVICPQLKHQGENAINLMRLADGVRSRSRFVSFQAGSSWMKVSREVTSPILDF